jgi:hypothetical protein
MPLRKLATLIAPTTLTVLLATFVPVHTGYADTVKPPASSASADSKTRSGKIAATVNGEPIYEAEVLRALPEDTFDVQRDNDKKNKLARLIDAVIKDQFLKQKQISVTERQIDQEIERFVQMLTTTGGTCCGAVYDSLTHFMQVHSYTGDEVRKENANNAGMALYVKKLLQKQITPQALSIAVKRHRAQIESKYIKGFVIAFPYSADTNLSRVPEEIKVEKERRAKAALARLDNGESFAAVAKATSEDKMSANIGGALGCVNKDIFGAKVGNVFKALPFGKHSDVIKTRTGYYIVMHMKLTEEDERTVASKILEEKTKDKVNMEYHEEVKRAKIVYDPPAD